MRAALPDLTLSPYLSGLAQRYPDLVIRALETSVQDVLRHVCFSLPEVGVSQQALMQHLRVAKQKLALLVGLADLSGAWSLVEVTRALSDFADHALGLAVRYLLQAAALRGEITLHDPEQPEQESGIIILGMGKLGGHELNYSSDIDLILFFERDRLAYSGRGSEQQFMNRLAQDLVSIMQERTVDGYVFRTDLRLRPDPASTPPAIHTLAAYHYYESVGQNWERAAMIKARPVAGDVVAAERFLAGLTPYIWRRSLDFAAINDIHSIKRQMDARSERRIQMAGHNIKLGLGGIREIEFYVQIHQLIWGGRKPKLRLRGTCETLQQLVLEGLIDEAICKELTASYALYRMLEHRLQMRHDEQTHSFPTDPELLAEVAQFAGYPSLVACEQELLTHLHRVHHIYATSFTTADELGAAAGNLVFTGVSSDPETVKTLMEMGYTQAETICDIIMGWHHGSKRCTRTKRARELLTELMPALLARLAATAQPDAAFLKFDEFLTHLPAAIQLFSLFQANKDLLGLVADIMGSAPALADTLAKSPELIENVLFSDFYQALPDRVQLMQQASERLAFAQDPEEAVEHLTYFRNERQFQAGVQFLKSMVGAQELGHFLTDLAEVVMTHLLAQMQKDFEKTYGAIPGGAFAVIVLGKAGSRELTFHSDLDLVLVYRVPDFEALSDGEKRYSASVYYNRFAQRLVSAFTSLTRAGKLYEVDTRLRPSGKQGLLAISDQALAHYFEELAWTFEYMAFTKARAVAGDTRLCEDLNRFIRTQIEKPREVDRLKRDVHEMRLRMSETHMTEQCWDLKHVRGGMVDLDFIAQYLLLRHAPAHADGPIGSSAAIFDWCLEHRVIEETTPLHALRAAAPFFSHLFHVLRLCTGGGVWEEANMPPGLQHLLCASLGMLDMEEVQNALAQHQQSVRQAYEHFFHEEDL